MADLSKCKENHIYFGHGALDFFKAEGKQLPGLQRALHPSGGRLEVPARKRNVHSCFSALHNESHIFFFLLICMNEPFTLFAEVHRDLLGDSLGDVHLSAQTGHTHVGRVGRDGGATGTAQAEEEFSLWSTEYLQSRTRIG